MRKKIFYSALAISLLVLCGTIVAVGIALQLNDATPTFAEILRELAVPAICIFAAAVVLSAILSAQLARSIIKPINRISLTNPKRNEVYAELSPLVDRIDEQNRQIETQLAEMRAEHEERDAMRRDFTANVSHELKTPLTSISGYAELLKNEMVAAQDVTRFAGKIYEESHRLITLVGDIIKLSQLDSKEVAVKTEDIDLYETCAAVLSHLEMAAEKKQVTLSLKGEHIHIKGVYQIVEEMIFNLCDNAIKYNVQGGQVKLSIKQCVDGVQLTVRDTGIGIAKEDIPHIFERFYCADKSHSKAIGGTGLGLSIVKHGARFLGASVSVSSRVGVGTTMRILF